MFNFNLNMDILKTKNSDSKEKFQKQKIDKVANAVKENSIIVLGRLVKCLVFVIVWLLMKMIIKILIKNDKSSYTKFFFKSIK